jgi:hypothetical protein
MTCQPAMMTMIITNNLHGFIAEGPKLDDYFSVRTAFLA